MIEQLIASARDYERRRLDVGPDVHVALCRACGAAHLGAGVVCDSDDCAEWLARYEATL